MQPVQVGRKGERGARRRGRQRSAMDPRRPNVTLLLIGANVAVYAVMVAVGISPTSPDVASLLAVGANRGTLVVFQNEWWRALTSMFIHIGALHLAVNMYSLYKVGGFVERMLGGPLYALVYVLSGLGGAFASVLWNPLAVSAGASGAIFGIFGFVAGFAVQARHLLPPDTAKSLRDGILATLAINLFLAFTVPFLDNAAHIGGLSVGFLAGFVGTASAIEREGRGASFGSQLIVIAAVVALAVLAKTRTENNPKAGAAELLEQAQGALASNKLDEAEALATQALARGRDPRALAMRAMARLGRAELEGARADLDDAIRGLDGASEGPLLAMVLSLRGDVHLGAGRFVEAERDFARAYALRADPALLGQRGYARLRGGDLDGGLDDARAALADRTTSALALNNAAWALLAREEALGLALELVNASLERQASAAAQGTRCWILAASGEPDRALPDCLAATQGGGELMDRGMVAFLQRRPDEALGLWEAAATRNAVDARDLEPWLARARAQLDAGAP